MTVPSPRPIAPVVGSRLDPSDVIGRDLVIVAALGFLGDGMDLVCHDPRRMGKTCVLDRLVNEPGDSVTAIKIDYEGVESASEFLLRTARAIASHATIWAKVQKFVGSFLDITKVKGGVHGINVEIAKSQTHRTPQEVLERLILAIDGALDANDGLLVLGLDEVPLAIQNIVHGSDRGPTEATLLLQQLRRIRKATKNIRWIVTGSVGFHHVLKKCEGATEGVIGDLRNLPLGPLELDWATHLVDCLTLGIEREVDSTASRHIVAMTDGIPFLIQSVLHTIRTKGGSGRVTVDEADEAYAAFIDDRDESRAVDHFLNRIDVYFDPSFQRPARTILDVCAIEGHQTLGEFDATLVDIGLDNRDDRQELLNLLVDDHYLKQAGALIGWRYNALKKIWIQRRGLR